MKKTNYNMDRKDRERARQAKAAAKLEKRASKSGESSPSDIFPDGAQGATDKSVDKIEPNGV